MPPKKRICIGQRNPAARRQKAMRASETPEQRELRLQRERIRASMARARETSTEREIRLQKQRVRTSMYRANRKPWPTPGTSASNIIMDLVCRACLKMNTVSFNIFQYSQNEKLISDTIMELTSIKISEHDGFPVNICNDCLEKLNSAYDFKQMIIESDRKLLQSQQEYKTESPDNISREIWLKEESVDVESEQVEFSPYLSCNDQNTTTEMAYTDWQNISIKQEDESDLNHLNDYDRKAIISTENAYEHTTGDSKSNLTEEYTTDLDKAIHPKNQIYTLIKNVSIKKDSDKHYSLNEEVLKLIDNPDCKRIMESGLSQQEKNRATVFCKECNRTLNFRYYIERHIHNHIGNLLFKCDQCNLHFAKEYLLNKHKRAHSQKGEFICEKCGKSYFHRRDLNNHRVTQCKDKKVACNTCGKLFAHKGTLNVHLKSHLGITPHVCVICGRQFVYKPLLDHHVLIHNVRNT